MNDEGEEMAELEPEEEPEEEDVPVDAAQGLLDYLSGLTEYLPDDVRTTYEDSEMKLRMEALRSKLKGQGGLHAIAERLKQKQSAQAQAQEYSAADTAAEEPPRHSAPRPRPRPRSAPKAETHVTEAEQMGLFNNKGYIHPQQIESTFGYLESLTDQHPNQSIGVALKRKMHDIIEKLRGT
ncbi:MAG: hypothetical protein ACOC2R_00305 [Spirochaetota bacterium]